MTIIVNTADSKEIFAKTGLLKEIWEIVGDYSGEQELGRLALTCKSLYATFGEKIKKIAGFYNNAIEVNVQRLDKVFSVLVQEKQEHEKQERWGNTVARLYKSHRIAVDQDGKIIAFGKEVKSYAHSGTTHIWFSFVNIRVQRWRGSYEAINLNGIGSKELLQWSKEVPATFFQMTCEGNKHVRFALIRGIEVKRENATYLLPKQNNRDKIERMMAKLANVYTAKSLDTRKCVVM